MPSTDDWPTSFELTGSLRVKELEDRLSLTLESVICALSQLLDLKDLNTGVHSTRLAEWAVRVAQQLGVEESSLRDIEIAAMLHDIGKMGVPDAVLNRPGRLADNEIEIMRKHPEYGWAILRLIPGLENAGLFILHHHENFDGSGYPGALSGDEIPLGARIVSVIDSFDAMVSSRPYRAALPFEEAVRRLILASGTQFDPMVVRSFLQVATAEAPAVFAATGSALSFAKTQNHPVRTTGTG